MYFILSQLLTLINDCEFPNVHLNLGESTPKRNRGDILQTRILENMNPLTSWLRSSVRGSSKVTPATHNIINKGIIKATYSCNYRKFPLPFYFDEQCMIKTKEFVNLGLIKIR